MKAAFWSSGMRTSWYTSKNRSGAHENWAKSVGIRHYPLLADLHRRTRHVVADMLAITNVRVFDTRKAIIGEPSTVYLYRGKVAAVMPAAKPVAYQTPSKPLAQTTVSMSTRNAANAAGRSWAGRYGSKSLSK